ncbi:MAG: helix-turn-helix domain-containing protein [Bacteroidales bacterium]|nr:helix-turn-helix domain-containing protein [Bacteroidales bacterium]
MKKNKEEWFKEKMAAVSPEVMSEVLLSAEIIARIDVLLKEKGMTQRDLAQKLGKSEAVVSRWTTGFPNLTLKSIAAISTALEEPLIMVPGSRKESHCRR